MKPTIKLLLIPVLLWIVGCNDKSDPSNPWAPVVYANFSYYYMINDSDHIVDVSLITEGEDYTQDKVLYKSDTISWNYMSLLPTPSSPLAYYDKVRVSFDNGIFSWTYDENSYDYRPYYNIDRDPTIGSNYEYEELTDFSKDGPRAAKWTYTFTNADYEAAKALSQGNEEM